MRHSRSTRPQLEILESMTLLSTLTPVLTHPGGLIIPADTSTGTTTPVSLNGTVKGNYHVTSKSNPDVGLTYDFSGNGKIGALGHVHATGHLHSVGNIAEGHATGLIVLSDPSGSLTLHVAGPEQKGFASLPDRFTFKITNGSGKYRHDTGTGTVVFVRDPAGTASITTSEHGTFTMVFVS